MIKNILLYIWQLPQNIVGLIVLLCVKGKNGTKEVFYKNETISYYTTDKRMGVSLGNYRIVNKNSSNFTILHEYGHSRQSVRLGWLYLLFVGLPSATINIWDRVFHKNWTPLRRYSWYHSKYPENWADKLGGITSTQ